jgi:malonyl-CoA decarboxylase
VLLRVCAHYLVAEKKGNKARDPVADFHLNNGARLERINWLADTSENGLRQSTGIMVNYVYRLGEIEKNHEVYRERGEVATSVAVNHLL